MSTEGLLRRFGWPWAVVMTVLALTSLAGCRHSLSPAAPTTRIPPSSPAPLKTFSQWFDERQVNTMTRARWAAVARRSSIVVLNSWNFRLIPILKRANPNVRVWVYKDLSGIRSDDCSTSNGMCGHCQSGITDSRLLSSGMGYCWVMHYHPRWLLDNAVTGRPFHFRHYPTIWETDYGNEAYQRRWIQSVLADVRGHGWDGVEVDNALTAADTYGVAAKYRNDAAVQAATYSALRRIGHALRNAGVVSVFNVGYATQFPGLWQQWLKPVDGLQQEFYLAPSARPRATGTAWRMYEQEITSCSAQHKSCWFESTGLPASGTSPYALASYLLAANGQQLLGVGTTASLTRRCWRLGEPEGPQHQVGSAWRRFFRWGVAVANPTNAWLTVSLDGSYLDQRGRAADAVRLPPASGAVLRAIRSGPAGVHDPRGSSPSFCLAAARRSRPRCPGRHGTRSYIPAASVPAARRLRPTGPFAADLLRDACLLGRVMQRR